jgi:ABC-type oligopeptide transport system substrate-binding subunit
MSRLKKLILLALALSGASLLSTGCSTKTEQDSTIPWSRPANWEGGIPGMGGLGGGGGYR